MIISSINGPGIMQAFIHDLAACSAAGGGSIDYYKLKGVKVLPSSNYLALLTSLSSLSSTDSSKATFETDKYQMPICEMNKLCLFGVFITSQWGV